MFSFTEHRSCLKALNDLPKEDRPCEKTVQEVLALHLFQPLAMKPIDLKVNKSCVESATKERNHAKDCKGRSECFFCKTQIKTGNTSFGMYKNVPILLRQFKFILSIFAPSNTGQKIVNTEVL